ncbi:MAG: rhodanese-like domain-containing protein [Bacteroidales bacterium]|nr:rhodanese-like domain-containing protein [Bacteroidales bacterium]
MKSKTKTKVWMLAILFISFFVVSCEKENEPDPDPINEAELLVEWLESPTSPAANYGNSGLAIKSAEAVHTLDAADQVTIIDIRSAADFDDGHIAGAVNLAPGEVRNYIDGLASYNEISIVCYTGQTASWLTCLLQLAGYKDVYSMGFGMSAWAEYFDKWSANTASIRDFVSDVSPKGDETELPTLSTGFETAEEIFDARWETILAEGFGAAAISNSEVYDNLDNYYIINYWPGAEYLDPGQMKVLFSTPPTWIWLWMRF